MTFDFWKSINNVFLSYPQNTKSIDNNSFFHIFFEMVLGKKSHCKTWCVLFFQDSIYNYIAFIFHHYIELWETTSDTSISPRHTYYRLVSAVFKHSFWIKERCELSGELAGLSSFKRQCCFNLHIFHRTTSIERQRI